MAPYKAINTFGSLSLAKKYSETLGSFSYHRTGPLAKKTGTRKLYYRCNLNIAKGKQCPVRIYYVVRPDGKAELYHSKETNHQHAHSAKCKITVEIVNSVKRQLNKSKRIPLKDIRDDVNHECDSKLTIHQIKYIIKNKREETEILTFGDLDSRLKELKFMPQDGETPYCVKYEVTEDLNRVLAFFTSKTLLMNVKNSTCIHLDGTQKLSLHGFPVFVLGKFITLIIIFVIDIFY